MPKSRDSEIVIVANRLPVHRVKKRGKQAWQISPGGLVSALKPILQQRTSTWVGWAGTAGKAPAPFEHEGIRNLPVRLSREEVSNFYEGFSNGCLWPLYHDAVRTPSYHRRWWYPYLAVNEKFAEAAADRVAEGGLVWVHDYQLQIVPALLRRMRPDVRIGFFLHIPFPPEELFAQLPWRRAILQGLLGADVVGFQTSLGARNFVSLCRQFVGATRSSGGLKYEGRTVRVDAFPVSIDFERYESLARDPDVQRQADEYRDRVGNQRRIIVGVDRLDYTKGIDIRLRAHQEMLRSGAVSADEVAFVQVAVPSRERVEEYKTLRSRVEQLIGEINGEFGDVGRTPVHYLHRSLPADELVALYCAADVMLVTPLRDGMNLVAKEYCAARLDDTGVLVLSEFTGAAKELDKALLVNPHDIDGLRATMETALRVPPDQQRRRMRALRRAVRRHDVYRWADEFLGSLA